MCIVSVVSYNPFFVSRIRNIKFSKLSLSSDVDSTDVSDLPIPTNLKSRLRLILGGKNVNNAVFRADLKKELTFYRVH
jgi:hypothetical protein